MKSIGLFYSRNTVNTAEIAKKIEDAFNSSYLHLFHVEEAWKNDFESHDFIIAGVPTWFDGELPAWWDEIIPELGSIDFRGKKVAIFGLGDQVNYPDNFVDGIGTLARLFESAGAVLTGFTSTDGYTFNDSLAVRGAQFAGLVIDEENQPEKTDQRINKWVEELKKEFV